MGDTVNDDFEYISQLTKSLGDECRSTRQETDKIELLLKRVAKQSSISYEQLSQNVSQETFDAYRQVSTPSETDLLMRENAQLLYQIEQQDYINKKIVLMIKGINDHLQSVKNYIIEQKLTREQDFENFLYENIHSKKNIVRASMDNLKLKNELAEGSVDIVIEKFKTVFNEIDWTLLRQDSEEYKSLIQNIESVEKEFDITLR